MLKLCFTLPRSPNLARRASSTSGAAGTLGAQQAAPAAKAPAKPAVPQQKAPGKSGIAPPPSGIVGPPMYPRSPLLPFGHPGAAADPRMHASAAYMQMAAQADAYQAAQAAAAHSQAMAASWAQAQAAKGKGKGPGNGVAGAQAPGRKLHPGKEWAQLVAMLKAAPGNSLTISELQQMADMPLLAQVQDGAAFCEMLGKVPSRDVRVSGPPGGQRVSLVLGGQPGLRPEPEEEPFFPFNPSAAEFVPGTGGPGQKGQGGPKGNFFFNAQEAAREGAVASSCLGRFASLARDGYIVGSHEPGRRRPVGQVCDAWMPGPARVACGLAGCGLAASSARLRQCCSAADRLGIQGAEFQGPRALADLEAEVARRERLSRPALVAGILGEQAADEARLARNGAQHARTLPGAGAGWAVQPHAPGTWPERDQVSEDRALAFGQGLEAGRKLAELQARVQGLAEQQDGAKVQTAAGPELEESFSESEGVTAELLAPVPTTPAVRRGGSEAGGVADGAPPNPASTRGPIADADDAEEPLVGFGVATSDDTMTTAYSDEFAYPSEFGHGHKVAETACASDGLQESLDQAVFAEQGPQEAERIAQAVLNGQLGFIRKRAADYHAELVRGVSALRLSSQDLEAIEALTLEGEAEIIAQMEQADEVEDSLLDHMSPDEGEAVVLLGALGVPDGAGRGAQEHDEEPESAKQELMRAREPRRLRWIRRRVAAMWLARLAGWPYPPEAWCARNQLTSPDAESTVRGEHEGEATSEPSRGRLARAATVRTQAVDPRPKVVTASLYLFISSRLLLCTRALRAPPGMGGLAAPRRSITWNYLVHFTLYWPLYVYCFTSHEFLAQFRTFQECGYHHPDLYAAFRLFGYCSGLVSMMASFFLIWQVVFIWDTRTHPRPEVVGAPPNLIETLPFCSSHGALLPRQLRGRGEQDLPRHVPHLPGRVGGGRRHKGPCMRAPVS
ncbi:unnamed protein product [Prorocentrum cordatum]|uniref:Glycerophosphocholine acyltransferase 1 n=1 Tax=Prorocentrum cordatum TaxID=2364126 RepID=A0ABN9T7I8_9DINO|nr:unnamed protein product [Polarella glacialis]